jgi:hypothetical protein
MYNCHPRTDGMIFKKYVRQKMGNFGLIYHYLGREKDDSIDDR